MRKRWLNSNWSGGWLLLVAFGIGLGTLFWGTFVDEGDNLAVGLMLSRGSVLYRDIFSHHFPFAYYWMAAVTGLFGSSIAAARISILLFQMSSFAWAMYVTRYIVPIGLLAVLWNIVGLFFFSNLVLYTGFSSVALTVVFIVTIAILIKRISAGRKELLTLGIFAAIAVLSDPLAVYPILCLLVFLSLSPARFKGSVLVGSVIAVGLGAFGLYLLASDSAGAFYRDVVHFNAEVYSKYTTVQPFRLADILNLAGSALNLSGPAWQADPFMILKRAQLDHWLFAGFLFRMTIVLATLLLVVRRRFASAGFVYLYAVMLLAINQDTFRSMPFAMTASFVGTWLVFENLDGEAVGQLSLLTEGNLRRRLNWLGAKFLPWLTRCLIGCGFVWLLLRSADAVVQNRHELLYTDSFAYYTDTADYIRHNLTCEQSDVALAYYPGEPTFNYLTGLPPVSKYLYLWPWVAEVALPEVVQSLQAGKAVVYVDWLSPVWDIYQAENYLAPLKAYLEANYQAAGRGFYVSPELARECRFTRAYPHTDFPAERLDGELVRGRKYAQTFTSECAGLSFFEFFPATYQHTITSTLNVRFRDLSADQQLFDRAILGADITDYRWYRMTFDPIPDSKGKRYRISLVSSDAEPGNAIGVWRTAKDVYPAGEASVDGRPLQADWVFRYGCQP